MNNDVVQKILLHLPVQTLLRFRAVSKSWCDVINSPSFRKLHTNNNDNNNNGRVCLEFNFPRDQHCNLSIKLLDNGLSFKLPYNFGHLLPPWCHPDGDLERNKYLRFVGPVKGLICIFSAQLEVSAIAICNPFLGQFKILPKTPFFPQCRELHSFHRKVGIAMDFHGDYKVVEFVFCKKHYHHHARIYSRRRDSWRELAGDGVIDQIRDLMIIKPVKSASKNGYFMHWLAWGVVWGCFQRFVLTFDVRNEVFRANIRPDRPGTTEVLAMDGGGDGEDSFVLFNVGSSNGGGMVEIHEEGNFKYEYVYYERKFLRQFELKEAWRRKRGSEYVALKNVNGKGEVSLYDYRRRRFVARFELAERSEITEYVGSFVSV